MKCKDCIHESVCAELTNEYFNGDKFNSSEIETICKDFQLSNQWISVKDKLPEEKPTLGHGLCNVIAYFGNANNKKVDQVYYLDGKFSNGDFDVTKHITYWMPLPEPPEEN